MITYEKMISGYEDSIETFYKHAGDMSDISTYAHHRGDCEYILRHWHNSKQNLFKMLGENLIISKPIEFSKNVEIIETEMYQMINNHRDFVCKFQAALERALNIENPWNLYGWQYANMTPNEKFYFTVRQSLNEVSLIENRISSTVKATVLGNTISLSEGQKIIRALGKLATILGLQSEFESFRIAHSNVLNQRKLTGTLHLSIHPLDFATASDNAADWSSCMSWYNSGCYRLGTVEMMNSPIVLCAYLASDKTRMDDLDWNSKKWRTWIIVDRNALLVNKHYPYHNDELGRACFDWVRELAAENLGWTYEEPVDDFEQGNGGMYFTTNFMYNDIEHNSDFLMSYGVDAMDGGIEINYSGVANCMWCGAIIDFDSYSHDDCAGTLTCEDCAAYSRCSDCGDILREGEGIWGPDDNLYCEDCYSTLFTHCDACNEIVDRCRCNTVRVYWEPSVAYEKIDKLPDGPEKEFWASRHSLWRHNEYYSVCSDCFCDRDFDVEVDFKYCSDDNTYRPATKKAFIEYDYYAQQMILSNLNPAESEVIDAIYAASLEF